MNIKNTLCKEILGTFISHSFALETQIIQKFENLGIHLEHQDDQHSEYNSYNNNLTLWHIVTFRYHDIFIRFKWTLEDISIRIMAKNEVYVSYSDITIDELITRVHSLLIETFLPEKKELLHKFESFLCKEGLSNVKQYQILINDIQCIRSLEDLNILKDRVKTIIYDFI